MALDVLAKNQIVGIYEETISGDWGTPATASTQFKRQKYNVGVSLPEFGKTESNFEFTGSHGEMEEQDRIVNDSSSGLKRVPFAGFATKANIADHLMAAYWDLYTTEGAATPYTKIFNCGDSQFDFPAGDGVTYSIGLETNHGDSPAATNDGIILHNAVIDSLTFSIDMNASGAEKYMKMNGVWVGRDTDTSQNFSSTWLNEDGTAYSNSYSPTFYNVGSDSTNWFALGAAELTVGGTSYGGCLRNFEWTINNNITSDCVTTGGKPNNYKRSRSITWSVDIPYNSSRAGIFAAYKDNSVVALNVLDNGTAYNAAGGFQFAHLISYMTAEPVIVEGDYLALRLQCKAVRPNAGFVGLIGVSDEIDKGW